jgi:hypothetical protein
MASRMTKRPLYRIRLSGQIANPDAVFHKAKTLNEKWGCIILIENILEATCDRPATERYEIMQPLLRFIDNYTGIVIFFLPEGPTYLYEHLDPLIAQRVCMNITFTPEDFNENCRQELWQGLISQRSRCSDLDEESRQRVASFASAELTADEIRSIVDAVLPPDLLNVKPDWELMNKLVLHRVMHKPVEVPMENDSIDAM